MRVITDTTDTLPPPVGHNGAPETDALTDRLQEEHADLLATAEKLAHQLANMPARIAAEDQRHKASEFAARSLGETAKRLEEAHKAEKEPFLVAGKTCDRILLQPAKLLRDGKQRVERLIGAYLAEVAERERLAREEAARLEREEAERKRREAEEAAAQAETEEALEAAIQAEEEAAEAHYTADIKEQAAQASNPDLTRAVSTGGVLSSLKTEWQCTGFDRPTLDLEPLRPYLPQAALEQALRAYVKAGGRSLRGAVIREVPKATIR